MNIAIAVILAAALAGTWAWILMPRPESPAVHYYEVPAGPEPPSMDGLLPLPAPPYDWADDIEDPNWELL